MKTFRKLALFAILINLFGCSTSIQSNKARDFNQKIKSYLCLIRVGDHSQNFVPKFSEELKEGLKLKGVEVSFASIDPLSLDADKELNERMTENKAEGLLIINQVESVTYVQSNTFYLNGPKASEGSFDIKIFIPSNKKPVWRGLMKASNKVYGSLKQVAKSSAETIINKLIEDGMI